MYTKEMKRELRYFTTKKTHKTTTKNQLNTKGENNKKEWQSSKAYIENKEQDEKNNLSSITALTWID